MSDGHSGAELSFAEKAAGGIPIRNVWHMLAYAWSDIHDLKAIGRGLFDPEDAPTIDALLASLLAGLVVQRLRVGLVREYVDVSGQIRGIKGKIDF